MKKGGSDPATLFEQLSSIENQFKTPGSKMNLSPFIAAVLDTAPEEYQSVISSMREAKSDKIRA